MRLSHYVRMTRKFDARLLRESGLSVLYAEWCLSVSLVIFSRVSFVRGDGPYVRKSDGGYITFCLMYLNQGKLIDIAPEDAQSSSQQPSAQQCQIIWKQY